jgi:hypothetical protein
MANAKNTTKTQVFGSLSLWLFIIKIMINEIIQVPGK